nr:MAG TPA: hypothetical protein [Caudoviricetes sp.]
MNFINNQKKIKINTPWSSTPWGILFILFY